ncbi:MAG: AraC family transcriptional regulator [Oscillospiraceae bacterium]|nr:AraC family transcriptional regulator [Oscillospiraceae bacterium]
MQAWKEIQKSIDYIEDNIADDIAIEHLAAEVGLSPFYYQRLFSQLVKTPVREYITLRRLARACGELQDKRNRILDVALDYGFSCHETFTRAFKETYGLTPSEYRKNPVALKNMFKPDLLFCNTKTEIGVPLISDGLVLEINRRTLEMPIIFTGITGNISAAKTGIDVHKSIWERFQRECKCEPNLSATYDSTYFLGSNVAPNTKGFVEWTLPVGEYVVCGYEEETLEQLRTRAVRISRRFTESWIAKHGLKYGDFKAERHSTNGEIYAEWWFPLQ